MSVPLISPLVTVAVFVVVPILLAALASTLVSLLFRLKAKDRLPDGAVVIVALGVVSIYLNTRLALIEFTGDGADPLTLGEVWMNATVFVGAAIAAFGGRRAGDRAATSKRLRRPSFGTDLTPFVRAAGRYIVLRVPEEIHDIEGYDAVDEKTKETLAGREFTFPRGMTVAELHAQFTGRLRGEYEVGYVDAEIDEQGTVTYLAVGKRSRGLGPTLPSGTHAVALRADPAFSASPGDVVQIWDRNAEGSATRLGRGELRATAGRVATVATTERTAQTVDPNTSYRLMTLASDTHPDREFAAMLRRADETLSVVEVAAESPLVGSSIAALSVTVIAVRTGETVTTLPTRKHVLAVGDQLFALGRPDVLRRLEAAARTGGEPLPDERIGELVGSTAATVGWNSRPGDSEKRRTDREDWTDYDDDSGWES